MRLREPAKGWKRSKMSYHIMILCLYAIYVAFILTLYLSVPLFDDPFNASFFLVVVTLGILYAEIDFKSKTSETIKRNIFALTWGSGVALLIGGLFSYLVLTRNGLSEKYVTISAVVTFVSALAGILFAFLGQKIYPQRAKKENST